MSKRIGVAVIGCGYWGMNYVRVFGELAETRVVVACDQRLDRLQEVVRRFPGVEPVTSISEMLKVTGVDAVVVCTNASTHYAVGRQCLEAGKHLLIEKPLTTIAEEAVELIELAGTNARLLMVGHTFVYNGGIRKVKEWMNKDGDQVYYLYSSRTNLGPIRHDVNALWDLAPHDVAIFNYLLDSTPEWVSAIGVKVLRNCREDVGFISLGYPGNVVGHVHVSWADPHKAREVVVVASHRRIVFNDLNGTEPVRVFAKGVRPADPEPTNYREYRFPTSHSYILRPHVEIGEPLKNQCRHFIECIAKKAQPLTGGHEGLEVVRVLQAVDRSIALGGAPVEISRNGYYYQQKSA